MFMIPLALAQAAAASYVLYICIMVLRVMTPATRLFIRVSYVLVSSGAMAALVSAVPSPGGAISATFTSALLCVGVAFFLASTERKTSCGSNS